MRPEIARNWSAASQRRFSSVPLAVSFWGGAIQCMVQSVGLKSLEGWLFLAMAGAMVFQTVPQATLNTSGSSSEPRNQCFLALDYWTARSARRNPLSRAEMADT